MLNSKEAFVEIYNSSLSDQEVASAVGIAVDSVRQKVFRLRNEGYELRRRNHNSMDYAYIAALLDEKSSLDRHGSSGRRLRLSVSSKHVLDFLMDVFPFGSVEEYRGKYRITWQRADEIDRVLDATKKYRRRND